MTVCGQDSASLSSRDTLTLREAHVGSLEIDSRLLDSYGPVEEKVRQFYLDARSVFTSDSSSGFDHERIGCTARKNEIPLMGGPMLGDVTEDGLRIWLRPAGQGPLKIKLTPSGGGPARSYKVHRPEAGVAQSIPVRGLSPGTSYAYAVFAGKEKLTEASFTTAPGEGEAGLVRICFGSCFHKIGLHNQGLMEQILKREPHAMLLLGDIAVDDRENNMGMHRSDYLLRDLSPAWQKLASHVPLYAAWDDHDYLNNDLSGVPGRFSEADRDALRAIWQENWNNPMSAGEGIQFSTRIGAVEVIMLDTRSCRTVEQRGQYASYLGEEQMVWLKEVLKNSTAPYKIISSGTMWSDDISRGKDSWGTWDTLAREEIFTFIEEEEIGGVLLISGDRHGARGLRIPRSSGYEICEFEAASLGGVPGPKALADDPSRQLFGYHGKDFIAFGEFTFDTRGETPVATFRLIDEHGQLWEEHELDYQELMPPLR